MRDDFEINDDNDYVSEREHESDEYGTPIEVVTDEEWETLKKEASPEEKKDEPTHEGGQMPNYHYEPPRKNPLKPFMGIALAIATFALFMMVLMHFGEKYFDNLEEQQNTKEVAKDKTKEETNKVGANKEETESTQEKLTLDVNQVGQTNNANPTLYDVSPIVEEVMPCIVAVTNTATYSPTSNWFSGGESTGAGSGVIIAQDEENLLVLTNAHVILPESQNFYTISSIKITVTFFNDVTVDAIVKGTHEDSDLAVLSIPISSIEKDTLSSIKKAQIGDSDKLKVGQGVIAIGNALGFGQSVTNGIISALNRDVKFSNITRTLLQTNAAINPGNSGGGLFNMYGELVAINSAKYASEEVEGIGYAIPITSSLEIIEELMNKEQRQPIADESKRGYLGIEGSDQYMMPEKGVFIQSVVEDSPAHKAGLKAYDIITAIDGESVESWEELVGALSYYEGGTEVEVTYLTLVEKGNRRYYEEEKVTIKLGSRSDIKE